MIIELTLSLVVIVALAFALRRVDRPPIEQRTETQVKTTAVILYHPRSFAEPAAKGFKRSQKIG